MDVKVRPTRVEINLDNLEHNLKEIRRITSPNAGICAVVKADAYGHGAVEVAMTALSFGAKYLAVAFLDEAVVLREAGIRAPILILGFTPEDQFDKILEYGITQTVYNVRSAEVLSREAQKRGMKAKVHIKLDTGMSRIGFPAEPSSLSDIEKVFLLPGIEVEGIFTHFARADEEDKSFTEEQYKKYRETVGVLESRGLRVPIKHVANSAAIIDMPGMHLDMVRPGIILYGIYPSEEVQRSRITLKPVMTFKTRVSHVKTVPAGTPISYGGTFVTKKTSVIATLPVGYADGYPRLLSSRAEVVIKGRRAPLVGRVCMDQCMVDVTDIPGVQPGDEVELFGTGENGGVTADEIAKIVGTIPYEIVCGISKRVPRIYIKDGKIIKIKNHLAAKV
ncbi:alanine racemase [Thermosediminibacter oceani]|uniref:Alanine racemase n=1 Tax=Thermosediminibacter oceani (strain ATCC BAA-1034 / DSM 16646 / JW/IW-1228P) TaxID=555079 RepID=D9RZ90_THEOJ|nr:alanine racemase [Thermosediminibacter oceani]ADL08644.1 alanine racemase [Thermosediminibacter oceani DSM 16646]